eukprot:SAG31_NODE_3228_length_4517_cov_2.643730_2_plen_154_part_00
MPRLSINGVTVPGVARPTAPQGKVYGGRRPASAQAGGGRHGRAAATARPHSARSFRQATSRQILGRPSSVKYLKISQNISEHLKTSQNILLSSGPLLALHGAQGQARWRPAQGATRQCHLPQAAVWWRRIRLREEGPPRGSQSCVHWPIVRGI